MLLSRAHSSVYMLFLVTGGHIFLSLRMDLSMLPLEHVEILSKLIPNDDEVKKFQEFTKDKKNPKTLDTNDLFIYEVTL